MALEIVWTKRAERGFDKIFEYLETHFSDKEVSRFVQEANRFFDLLKVYPEILKRANHDKYLHRGPVNKYTMLTYRVKPEKGQIQLINIRSTRQKPLG